MVLKISSIIQRLRDIEKMGWKTLTPEAVKVIIFTRAGRWEVYKEALGTMGPVTRFEAFRAPMNKKDIRPMGRKKK
jgi:hypothetical protein